MAAVPQDGSAAAMGLISRHRQAREMLLRSSSAAGSLQTPTGGGVRPPRPQSAGGAGSSVYRSFSAAAL
eukprot:CAMPEP_0204125534 /NCGR_PEP_ID=MMETSP0361-20130328/10490_1 /ASSEMBLY_ACC=CAM_ASM_000343 /TAXON_ID=268821 /ORGANISM="Scrippsiella Hangoei, Strain SHTV-5" /LENGTH=68 /DNA_ID=CAMNT_0051077277 /DNA_START=81 /DNA_END=284 /DNA_ORIENTATION=+